MKLKRQIYLGMVTIIVVFGYACKKNNGSDTAATAPVTGVKLTANSKFGNIITDNNGRALYFFAIDANGSSGCNDGCAVTWPVFYKDNPSIGTGLNAADFSTITRSDGSKQTSYKGWPLYYYLNDTKTGDLNGDAVNNTWFVAKNDYTVMLSSTQLVGSDGIQYTGKDIAGIEITPYITDASGQTLYNFAPDKFEQNTFTKPDFSNDPVWPIYSVNTIQSIPSILDKSQFNIITVFGKTQLVYKGHPLYYFGNDKSVRGNTLGVSFPKPGIWFINNLNTTVASM